MRKTKILYLCIGIIIGAGGIFLTEVYLSYTDPTLMLKGHPQKFGDIEILALKAPDIQKDEDVDKALIMTKNGVRFFYADTNKAGTVRSISILGPDQITPHFCMFASDNPGGWERAMYSYDKDNKTVGNSYMDINCDGKFDDKDVYDNNGIWQAKYIYADNNWRRATYYEDNKRAKTEGIRYVFDSNIGCGWVRYDANSPEKHIEAAAK